ncbi:aminotransferase class I/II-fold pyridoxal phosphate-dependent enzyme [Dactylosporangium sp. NPDC005572]|uniref:aminotransferase class I/II-fold pyridoxal phosphate-dependent enzyme n=1 Tax=Dactylosporangium sp. NPDC005572 TaxID=3156889 RepID=UPI0033ACBE37
MITVDEYLLYTDRAFDGMTRIVGELGDDLANRRPALPGANTPYGLLTHCLGVVEYWAGSLVAGRPIERDRDREFTSRGPVAGLLARVAEVRAHLAADARGATPGDPPRGTPDPRFLGPDGIDTQGAVLQHVYEELCQHHGQMEVLRDALLAEHPARPLGEGHGVKWGSLPAGTLGAWVADMDLGIAPPIKRRLLETVQREDFGYPFWTGADPVLREFSAWTGSQHGWEPDPGRSRVFTDLLQILQVVVEHTTAPGDGVAIHVPAYPPFLASIARAGRRIVPIPMVHNGQRWTFDTDGLASRLAGCRLLVLVNPHNPTGRVFDAAELDALAAAADRHDLVVLSDEIHADLTYAPHRHVPFATLAPARTVTATSATKAFNIAGLRLAVAHVAPPALRASLDAAPLDVFGTPSILSRVATLAAWQESSAWLDGMRSTLATNRATVTSWAATVGVPFTPPEATYLAWLRSPHPAAALERTALVKLSEGAEFSAGTDVDTASFVRLNFATTPKILHDVLTRLTPWMAPPR